jgi:hypothetical protein
VFKLDETMGYCVLVKSNCLGSVAAGAVHLAIVKVVIAQPSAQIDP